MRRRAWRDQGDERGLRDVLSQVRIVNRPESGRIDEVDVAMYETRQRVLGSLLHKGFEKVLVVHIVPGISKTTTLGDVTDMEIIPVQISNLKFEIDIGNLRFQDFRA